jgi:exosortase
MIDSSSRLVQATGDEANRDPSVLGAAASIRHISIRSLVLLIGSAALAIPTILDVARESWSTEQGGHGPIILLTGLWLLYRLWPAARPHFKPAPAWQVLLGFMIVLPVYYMSRIGQIVEVEGFAMYGMLLVALFGMVGVKAMKIMWFPLVYMIFCFPPPDTFVAWLTLPLKSMISKAAVSLLSLFGYPVGGSGVTIIIGQYSLLVAAACSGINSLLTLSALALFFIYVQHQASPAYSLVLALLVLPIAVLANFIRVLVLILLTYHAGESAAQGFLHNFAGIVMFVIALGSVLVVDMVLKRVWDRRFGTTDRAHPLSANAQPDQTPPDQTQIASEKQA